MFGRKNRSANPLPFHAPYYGGGYIEQVTMPNAYQMRQQPMMNYYTQSQWSAMPYQGQNNFPYNMQPGMAPMQPFHAPSSYYQPQQPNFYQNPASKPSFSELVFQNPLQPMEEEYLQANQYGNQMQYANPYPKQSFIPRPPSGMQSIMNSFKGQDGSLDLNKMMNTAGQMMNAVTQVSSMVKGLGGFFKV